MCTHLDTDRLCALTSVQTELVSVNSPRYRQTACVSALTSVQTDSLCQWTLLGTDSLYQWTHLGTDRHSLCTLTSVQTDTASSRYRHSLCGITSIQADTAQCRHACVPTPSVIELCVLHERVVRVGVGVCVCGGGGDYVSSVCQFCVFCTTIFATKLNTCILMCCY